MLKSECKITDENGLDNIFAVLAERATADQCRPADQLSVNLDEYPNGIRSGGFCSVSQKSAGESVLCYEILEVV